jgi:hypothetical protein
MNPFIFFNSLSHVYFKLKAIKNIYISIFVILDSNINHFFKRK